jgi:hypothetical protein
MQRAATGFLLMTASLQAFAHEGHGVDAGAVYHYLTGPHLLLLLGAGLCVAGAGYGLIKELTKRH